MTAKPHRRVPGAAPARRKPRPAPASTAGAPGHAGSVRLRALERRVQALLQSNTLCATATTTATATATATTTATATASAQMTHGLSMFKAKDRLLVANRRWCDIWHLPEQLASPGTRFADIMAASAGTEVQRDDPADAAPADPTLPGRRRRAWRKHDGRVIEVAVKRLAGGVCVALHEDITERRRAEERIGHMARHDGLIDLPNRVQLRDELQRHLPRTQRGEALAVLCLDLDRFKAANDRLGHPAGDALLRQVAQHLNDCVRGGDVVARLGGDEFVILQVGAPQPAASTALARRLIEAIGMPFDLGGQQAHIGTSVGVAIAPIDGEQADQLLKNADVALYRAKAD